MKAYSIDFREKIVKAYEQGNTSIRKVASRFDVSKSFVQKLLQMRKNQDNLSPRQPGKGMKSKLDGYETQLATMVEKYPNVSLAEYCKYWGETHNMCVSTSTMCRALQKQQLSLKKRRYTTVHSQHKQFKKSKLSNEKKLKI